MPGSTGGSARPRVAVVTAFTFGTFLKVLLGLALAWTVVRLWSPFCLLLLSALIAITLSPILEALQRIGVSHGAGVSLLAFVVLGLCALVALLVIPPLLEQIEALSARLPSLLESLAAQIGGGHVWRRRIVAQILELPSTPQAAKWLHPLAWGPPAVEVLSQVGLVVVLSFYLLFDGRRVVAWLLAYVPRTHRRRMALTVPKVFSVVKAYMLGLLITSLLFAGFAFVVLTSLGVPAALPLALLAGVCDLIPVAGIFLAAAPAAALALTVSPGVSLLVLGLYIAYHQLEVYVLVPRIYGDRLQLSSLAVLLALIAGAALHGVVGAVLVLPLVAAYPVIEQQWLSDYLGPDVLADHSTLHELEGRGSDVVEAVLLGNRTPDQVSKDAG